MNYITFWKKFLLKCFIVSFLFSIFHFALWLLVRENSFAFAHNIFEIDKATYNKMVLDFFVVSKYIMFYVFLIPSLALYWMSKCQKQDWKKNIKLDD